jgi:hypothetical protein
LIALREMVGKNNGGFGFIGQLTEGSQTPNAKVL